MATFPEYVKILRDGASESFEPDVLASEMERGPAKYRVGSTRVMRSDSYTLLFNSRADAAAFEAWYFDTIKRVGWFDWRDPRTGSVVSARFAGGRIGALQPLTAGYRQSTRDVTVEWLK